MPGKLSLSYLLKTMPMFKITLFSLALLIGWSPLFAQRDLSEVQVNVIPVSDSIYMLTGAGGNIGLSVGTDGVFMIDDQFADLSPKIRAAIKTLSDRPVSFLVNTHFHGDHTGGNKNFEAAGATIVAQDNVRKRLLADQQEGLPIVTFNDQVTLHLNGNDILALHVDNAHTDSDAVVYFPTGQRAAHGRHLFSGGVPVY